MSSGKRGSCTSCHHQELENTGPSFIHCLELFLDKQLCSQHLGVAVRETAQDPAHGRGHRRSPGKYPVYSVSSQVGPCAEAEASPVVAPAQPLCFPAQISSTEQCTRPWEQSLLPPSSLHRAARGAQPASPLPAILCCVFGQLVMGRASMRWRGSEEQGELSWRWALLALIRAGRTSAKCVDRSRRWGSSSLLQMQPRSCTECVIQRYLLPLLPCSETHALDTAQHPRGKPHLLHRGRQWSHMDPCHRLPGSPASGLSVAII